MSSGDFATLLSPFAIAGRTVRNRIMLTTHNPKMSEERYLHYLETRVAGGVGMVGIPVLNETISTLAYVTPGQLDGISARDLDGTADPETEEGREFFDSLLLPPLRARADIAHRHGALVFGQVANRGSIRLPETFQAMVSPSGVPDPHVRAQPREMTTGEVERVVRLFARSASRIRRGGLDGVEVHATHGYLVEQFLSPSTNRRTDRYGGSLDNRMRFLTEVLEAIREECGPDFPIGMRISGLQAHPGGLTTDDITAVVRTVESSLAYVNITAGTIGALHDGVVLPYVASSHYEPGFNADAAAAVREAVSVPVILTGRMNDPALMEDVLRSGVADLVGTTRALIADPEFVKKTAAGRADRIHKCIGINECHYPDRVSACPVNPWAGRERELDVPAPVRRKRVLVVGGGPAGLMCARTAASRGHSVVLAEKEHTLGGKITLLARDPHRAEMASLIDDLTREVAEAGVEVRLGFEVTPEAVAEMAPDAVVVATGALPAVPDVPGLEEIRTRTALDILDTDLAELGENVLVVGGLNDHLAPLAAADLLAGHGKKVVLLSECILPGQAAEPSILHLLTKRLLEKHVRIEALTELVKAGVRPQVRNVFSGETSEIGAFDSVVFATGAEPVPFPETDGEFYRIGDCLAPRRLVHATLDGARIGSRL
ncbi:FAD-dependent oxidoreductase [Streptomyces griseoflavus]|uniref:oxidoreductase n=1 Tax=Streptomyces griseoflavus TaxID=35619 RepID=UPI00167D21DC|nr:FAD-dependent oxidoreductase [Streptomyces griseoflavus]GGV13471.1 NADH oxidase [Streptomyces griseoflavus]